MRINQRISQSGLCSRRQADRWLSAGLVCVNHQPASVGMMVDEHDHITVQGKALLPSPKPVYLLYHKPVGVTCTHDAAVANNWVQAVGFSQQLFAVGRLDKLSEGLMLLTNDGPMVNTILTAQNAHPKTYVVTVNKAIDDEFLRAMASGVAILNTVTFACSVQRLEQNAFKIVLVQGLNLQIRRMCKALGFRVERLQRIGIMALWLNDLPVGAWRTLTSAELTQLKVDLK